jgi:GNAT superfamily N-acetyltransferase
MGPFVVREASPADAVMIARIQTESWRDAYAPFLEPAFLSGPVEADRFSLWTDRLEHPAPEQIVLLAEQPDGEGVGFICAYYDADESWGSWIDNLHVLPSMRGRRLGERLLCSIAARVTRQSERNGLYLWVFEENISAIRFYTRLGGTIVGRDRSRIPAAAGRAILRIHWPHAGMISAPPSKD